MRPAAALLCAATLITSGLSAFRTSEATATPVEGAARPAPAPSSEARTSALSTFPVSAPPAPGPSSSETRTSTAVSSAADAPPASSENRTSAAAPGSSRGFTGSPEPRGFSSAGMLLIVGLALVAYVWWRRRGVERAAPEHQLETLAQASLGGRARALWLRAGQRHMIVAVSAQSVQTIDRWPDRDEAWRRAAPLAPDRWDDEAPLRAPSRTSGPAAESPAAQPAASTIPWLERVLGSLKAPVVTSRRPQRAVTPAARGAANAPSADSGSGAGHASQRVCAAAATATATADDAPPSSADGSAANASRTTARRSSGRTAAREGRLHRARRGGSRCRLAARRGRGEEGSR